MGISPLTAYGKGLVLAAVIHDNQFLRLDAGSGYAVQRADNQLRTVKHRDYDGERRGHAMLTGKHVGRETKLII